MRACRVMLCLSAAITLIGWAASPAEGKSPNFLIILCDDLGYGIWLATDIR